MIKKIVLLFTIGIIVQTSFSQDSLHKISGDIPYSSAFQLLLEGATLLEALSEQEKCGLSLMAEIHRNWDELSLQQKDLLSAQLQPPISQTSIVSPRRYFLIHYDTTGIHAPSLKDVSGNGVPDYIDSVAAIFDFVWEYYIDDLGYESPQQYGQFDPQYGDTLHVDVYVRRMSAVFPGTYGVTVPMYQLDKDTRAPVYRTYVMIDSRYEGFFSEGLDGLRVTAAHELHHVIQLGSYGWWSHETFFYEITSTWFEDVLYPEINDYFQYLPVIFSQNLYQYPFYHGGMYMYARAIWGHMMERRYGYDIMRRKWEHIKQMSPLEAIHQALFEHGSSFERELAEFHLWKFYTGTRARPDRYFLDGADYPMLKPKLVTAPFIHEATVYGNNIESQTLHHHAFVTEQNDTLFVLISNVNPTPQVKDHEFVLSVWKKTAVAGNNIDYRLFVDNLTHWKVIPVAPDIKIVEEDLLVYPNPFRIPQISSMSIVVESEVDEVQLSIFTSDMRLVYQSDLTPIVEFDQPVVRWDGRAENGSLVGSGVYVYVLRQGNNISRGKFTIVRNR